MKRHEEMVLAYLKAKGYKQDQQGLWRDGERNIVHTAVLKDQFIDLELKMQIVAEKQEGEWLQKMRNSLGPTIRKKRD